MISDRTSLQQHLPHYHRRYTVYRTQQTRLEWKINHPRLCAHLFALVCTCAKVFLGVELASARPLIHQTCFPAVCVLISDYFVVSNEYALGKCIGVIKKCSGVKLKVGWNIKTQVK